MALDVRVSPSLVYLSGSIDEHTPLEEMFAVLAKTPGNPLAVNLQGILRINSIGVRRWIPLISTLGRERQIVVEAMSYPLVMQANMLANLMGKAQIVSCMAPYFCRMCEANRMMLVKSSEVAGSAPAPRRDCPDCGAAMDFDELDDYFALFNHRGA